MIRFCILRIAVVNIIVCCQLSCQDDSAVFFSESGADVETTLSSAELTQAKTAAAAEVKGVVDKAEGVGFERLFAQKGFFEGDIARTPGGVESGQSDAVQTGGARQNSAIDEAHARWVNAVVPYAISSSYTERGRGVIAQALAAIMDASCVRFVPKEQFADYIYFSPTGGGCSSDVGRMGLRQEVTLGAKECMVAGVIMHELMHVLGFYHEQSRYDRDKFVKIVWANIEPAMDRNFLRYESFQATTLDTPYDYESIMHYGHTAFSKNGEPTILPNIEDARIGQRYKLSDFDIYEINKLYNCPGNRSMPEWPFSDSQSNRLCGSETYDVLTEGCCDGRRFALARFICCQDAVVPFAWGAGPRVECCGAEAVTPPQTCCNGSVMDMRDHVCCPTGEGEPERPFDIHRFACCRGTLHLRPRSGRWYDYTCCASNLIANRTHGCCGDELPYLLETQGCCFGKVFDKLHEYCCNLVVHTIDLGTADRTGCCAGKPYDIEKRKCCGGTQLYDAAVKKQICCRGVLHMIFPGFDLRCCQGLIETRSELYDYRTHRCCAEGQVNSTVYALVDSVCCRGRLHPYIPQLLAAHLQGDLRCCGVAPYNAKTEQCCRATSAAVVVPLAAGLNHSERDTASLCCGSVSVNSRTHACCQGELVSLADAGFDTLDDPNGGCCGKLLYNVTSEACCAAPLPRVVPLADGLVSSSHSVDQHAYCCTGVSFNAGTHACCDRTVRPLAPGLTLISPDGQWNPDAYCCGVLSYNALTHNCCGVKIAPLAPGLFHASHTIDPKSYCCRTVSFNRAVHSCCVSGEIIPRGHNCTVS